MTTMYYEGTEYKGYGMFAGKNAFLTGVASKDSIAFKTLLWTLAEDPERVILSVFPSVKLIARIQKLVETLPAEDQRKIDIIGYDVTNEEQNNNLADVVSEILAGKKVDAVLHSIARVDLSTFGSGEQYMAADSQKVLDAILVSAISYRTLLNALTPVLNDGATAAAITFESQKPMGPYGHAGDVKGLLETSTRHIANHLGRTKNMQVNCLSAAAIETIAATAIPNFGDILDFYKDAPIDGSVHVFSRTLTTYLAGLTPGITGSTLMVDGGRRECVGIPTR